MTYRYSRDSFKNIVCSQCDLCPIGTEPNFCFDEVYKSNRKLFMKKTLKKLKHQHLSTPMKYLEIFDLVKKVFCKDNFCKRNNNKKQCVYIHNCVAKFKQQLLNNGKPLLFSKSDTVYRKKRLIQPYPTFFCNEGFKKQIREIIDADNDKKQT